ncbi:hypothetical protein GCM10010459_21230 [Microbacterium schleiferi]
MHQQLTTPAKHSDARQRVTHSGKDRNGDITSIGTPGQYWSPRAKTGAISDIELGIHTYHVQWPEKRTEIRVVNGANGKYLRTDRDNTTRNNLADLPDL